MVSRSDLSVLSLMILSFFDVANRLYVSYIAVYSGCSQLVNVVMRLVIDYVFLT